MSTDYVDPNDLISEDFLAGAFPELARVQDNEMPTLLAYLRQAPVGPLNRIPTLQEAQAALDAILKSIEDFIAECRRRKIPIEQVPPEMRVVVSQKGDGMFDKNEAQQDLRGRRDLPVVHGVYRHYKGGLYTVVAVSIHEETGEPLVTYRSNARGSCWTRSLKNFQEHVRAETGTAVEGHEIERDVPRFRREDA